MVVLAIAGRHGAPVPMAENGVLAGWLLAGAGLTASGGVTTIAPGRSEDSLFLCGGLRALVSGAGRRRRLEDRGGRQPCRGAPRYRELR
jgi:hypothetical protein